LVPGRRARWVTDQWRHLLGVLSRGAPRAGVHTNCVMLRRTRALMLIVFGLEDHARFPARRPKALSWRTSHPAVDAREDILRDT
jgi:hypothetical protein